MTVDVRPEVCIRRARNAIAAFMFDPRNDLSWTRRHHVQSADPTGLTPCTTGDVMAYDEGLATRVREQIGTHPSLTEKRMLGGLAFLVNGNMACGVTGEDLMVRLSPVEFDDALAAPGARPFDMTGRPMKGWLLVGPEGHSEDAELRRWVGRGVAFAEQLPPK